MSTQVQDNALLQERLQSSLQTLGLTLHPEQVQQLMSYLALMQKWNKVYNLTALRQAHEMLSHHVLDSLATVPALQRWLQQRSGERDHSSQARILDVGSGGGLPGVVWAIACPELRVCCVDAVAKKTAFVQQVATQLKLSHLSSLHARVETLTDTYDLITSRAFASLHDFTTWSATALAPDGVWMALKGKYPEQEIQDLPASVQVFHVEQLTVPHLDAQRCVVWMRPGKE